MDLLTGLRRGESSVSIEDLARGFGLEPQEAEAVVGSVAPLLVQRLERNTLSRGGLADLVGMMGEISNHSKMLGTATLGSDQGRSFGNEILEQILVNKDASRALAAKASASSGISETLNKSMLPYIATMVLGWLSNKASGGLGDILSKLPQAGGGRGQTSGGGFPFPSPSASGTGGTMLPGPEAMGAPGRNPYGDLSDMIRRGGGQVGGGSLWNIVRSVLGGLMGFRSNSIVGWIIRMVVMRYGWSIARFIFGRLLLGR